MRRILFVGLLLCISMIVSGCGGVVAPSCNNDDFCSIDEKLLGSCQDCKPDLQVDANRFNAYYDANNGVVRADVCIVNKNGEMKNGVQVGWALSSSKEYKGDYDEQWIYFDSPDVRGNFEINADKGNLWQNANLRFANADEQIQCFSHEFTDVIAARHYYVHFSVNEDRRVEERSYDNNFYSTYAEGRSQTYPEYLIEEDFPPLSVNYVYGGMEYSYYLASSKREVTYLDYYANYVSQNLIGDYNTPSGGVSVLQFENEEDSRAIFEDRFGGFSDAKDSTLFGQAVKTIHQDNMVYVCELEDGSIGTWTGSDITSCPRGTEVTHYAQTFDQVSWKSGSKNVYIYFWNYDLNSMSSIVEAYMNLHPAMAVSAKYPQKIKGFTLGTNYPSSDCDIIDDNGDLPESLKSLVGQEICADDMSLDYSQKLEGASSYDGAFVHFISVSKNPEVYERFMVGISKPWIYTGTFTIEPHEVAWYLEPGKLVLVQEYNATVLPNSNGVNYNYGEVSGNAVTNWYLENYPPAYFPMNK